MRLVIREIDKYKSAKHKNKILTEYIIYLMYGDTPIEAYLEIGELAKNKKIVELYLQYNLDNKIKFTIN